MLQLSQPKTITPNGEIAAWGSEFDIIQFLTYLRVSITASTSLVRTEVQAQVLP